MTDPSTAESPFRDELTQTTRPVDGSEERSIFPKHLSPSQISSLLICGEQYRLTRLLHAPERPQWAGIGGSAVHRMTEDLDREAWLRGELV